MYLNLIESCFEKADDAIGLECKKINASSKSAASGIRRIAELLSYDKSEICLLYDADITRAGKKIKVVYCSYAYNPDFNEVLKSTGFAKFDPRVKRWNISVDVDEENLELIKAKLVGFFRVIVDLDGPSAYISTTKREEKKVEFEEPFYGSPVEVSKELLFDSLLSSRPQDKILFNQIYFFDGQHFQKLNADAFKTRQLMGLFRYAVEDGRPRYAHVTFLPKGRLITETFFYSDQSTLASSMEFFNSLRLSTQVPLLIIDGDEADEKPH